MPKLAWRELIQSLKDESDRKQYELAEKIDVHPQTISRWLGKKPPLPGHQSFESVARYLDISNEDLAARWSAIMVRRYSAYQSDAALAGEVREPAPAYDERGLLAEAKAIGDYDLRIVPVAQRPSLRNLGREVYELVGETEDSKQRLFLRLRSVLRSFRQLYQGAVDTQRQMPDPED